MYPFLILSSLSVGFYLVLLVALHRDTRRHRRMAVGTRSKISHNTKTIHVLRSTIGVPTNRRNSSVLKVAVPTFFAPDPITSGTTSYPDQARQSSLLCWAPSGPPVRGHAAKPPGVFPCVTLHFF